MRPNPEVCRRLAALPWHFADQDPNARDELRRRIEQVVRRRELITYSDLVRGLEFHVPSVRSGEPFQIDTVDWPDFDRALIGDFLGSLNAKSYLRDGVFLSAAVVLNESKTPGSGYDKFMLQIGAFRSKSECELGWARHLSDLYGVYAAKPAATS